MKTIKNSINKKILYTAFLIVLFSSCDNSKNKNHLSKASSPYLKEHADNPVNWYEWGDEALQTAKKENKPLLISIGYASCHWCHVMEKESFMDTAAARIMNDNFICIKVDREERPDIDNIYTNACQLISGSSGWPLNAFALPDGKPFFAGTYYPKQSWINLLTRIATAYKEQNKKVLLQAESLTNGMADAEFSLLNNEADKTLLSKQPYINLFDSVYKLIDITYGGIKGSPKFPMPSIQEFLLQYYHLTGEKKALDAVSNTLTRMALGGIYDQAGGGFCRYSIDSLWHVPHFEKMLYDNAQLMSVYAHAYQVTQNNLFKKVVTGIAEFIEKNLTSSEGAFYSSLNADTEKGEGEFYIWTYDEIRKIILDGNADLIASYFNVSQQGNWGKNKNILFASYTPDEFSTVKKMPLNDFENILNNAKKTLLTERNKRIKPSADDKVLTSWNALMLKGYIDAYTALGDESFLNKALLNAAFLEKNMLAADGHLYRNYNNGQPAIDAFLDDYALLAKAYIRLYQATFDKHWLDLSHRLTEYAIANFYDQKSGMFYYTSHQSEKPVIRKWELSDDVIPSSNAVMAEVLYNLNIYFDNADYFSKCSDMLIKIAGQMKTFPRYYSQWCILAGMFAYGTYEVAIMGKNAPEKNLELLKNYLPECIIMGNTDKENLPLLENKLPVDKTLIYVCTNRTCKLPVEEVKQALQQIKK